MENTFSNTHKYQIELDIHTFNLMSHEISLVIRCYPQDICGYPLVN
jgi:hypothetical protein